MNKVDKEEGKGLSSNDLTDELLEKIGLPKKICGSKDFLGRGKAAAKRTIGEADCGTQSMP